MLISKKQQKEQYMQIIKRIVDWQKERNLHLQEFSPINESANIIEEVLELNGYKVPK